jgi:hypothetical protein
MEYDDGLIACSDDGLMIRRYDMFLRPKSVPYAEIRAVRPVELGGLSFSRWRLWGSTYFRHWFNLDRHRPKKQLGLVLDLGQRWKPVITPDDPQRVIEVLRSNGVVLTEH